MKMLVLLVAAVLGAALTFYASSGGARGYSLKGPVVQREEANPNPRCVRKLPMTASATGGGCLMQKRKSRSA